MLALELLQISLGVRQSFSYNPSQADWKEMFEFGIKHSLLGILYVGLEKIEKNLLPEKPLLLKWFGLAESIKKRNLLLNSQCKSLHEMITADGLQYCVLKGQGVASLYEGRLKEYLASGDIDIWINAPQRKVLDWVRTKSAIQHFDYMHTYMQVFPTTPVEVHYRPMISRNVLRMKMLQKLAKQYNGTTFVKNEALGFCVPDKIYNAVHIFHHIYWHLLVEGVGLRQVVDMYFVLRNLATDAERKKVYGEIEYLGLEKFCSALMWVLREKLLLDEKYLICAPNKNEGEFLWTEIIQSGNMGHFDKRLFST